MCTAGSTIGILILSVTYFKSNDLVFMENPAYYGGIDIFSDLNRKIVHGRVYNFFFFVFFYFILQCCSVHYTKTVRAAR